jgi:hypothetical protein
LATYKLTSKTDHGITGLPTVYMGWHFTAATALDVFESFMHLQEAGWTWNLYPNPANPWTQQMSVVRSFAVGQPPTQLIIDDTNWYTTDGEMVRIITQDDANTNYDIEAYVPPTPPPPPDTANVVVSAVLGVPPPEPVTVPPGPSGPNSNQ